MCSRSLFYKTVSPSDRIALGFSNSEQVVPTLFAGWNHLFGWLNIYFCPKRVRYDIPKTEHGLLPWIHTNNMVYILNLKDLASFLIFSLYKGSKQGPSDPEAGDIPMCQCASLYMLETLCVLFWHQEFHYLNFWNWPCWD